MRSPPPALVALVLLMLLAPSAAAEGFVVDLPFTDLATASHLPVLSGSLDVRAPAGMSATIMHNVTGFEVTGLSAACWDLTCHRANGPLSVRVAAGSSVALRVPTGAILHLQADHAVAAPVDLDAVNAGFGELAAALRLAPSLAAATQGGILTVEPAFPSHTSAAALPVSGTLHSPAPVAPLPRLPDPNDETAAVLASLTTASRLEVVEAGRIIHTVQGQGGVLVQGPIQVAPVQADAFVIPCVLRCDLVVLDEGATADLRSATATLVGLVQLAQGGPALPVALGPWVDLLDPMAAGVFVDLPLVGAGTQFSVADLTFVRFERFEAALYPGAPASSGSGPLVIESGNVQGAPEFVGGRYFGMPLWSYFLWGAAIAAILVAAILRAPKRNERWDRLQWVGRATGGIALVVLVAVWHINFGRVLGVDATTSGLPPMARILIGAVELGTLLAMLLMVVLPARLLLSRLLRIARQGRLMGLAGPAATLVGILAGTPFLLGFVDLALRLFQ